MRRATMNDVLIDHFALLGLRLRTPRLELRLPDPQELAELADLAADGVHEPHQMPFTVPWTDLPPSGRALSVVQHHWRTLAAVTPDSWEIPFTVFCDGVVVGQQGISGKQFAITREVSSGSWLGLRFHGQGIGTGMRAAILHLAFAELGAQQAVSTAHDFNAASLGVSRKLGYRDDGTFRLVVRGQLTVAQRLKLTRTSWHQHRTVDVDAEGVAACLPLLGLS